MPSQVGSNLKASPEVSAYNRLPIEIVSGSGCEVIDANGKSYLDFYGGHAVSALGYAHPKLTAAIAKQAEELVFQSNAVDVSIREAASQSLVDVAPTGLEKVFLINSGAEAIENALRLAFLQTGRKRVTAIRGAFHGRTAAAAAITDHNEAWYSFPQAPFEVDWATPESFEDLEKYITDKTAAFVFEPVQGVAGAVDLSPEFVQYAASLCIQRGATVIADEIQTGIGRTGTMFAVEQLGITPDIMTVAKGLGGGFPVAAVLCTNQIAGNIKPGMLGTTFGGGPMACAAIRAVLEVVSEPGFLKAVEDNANYLSKTCLNAGVQSVSGRGYLMGLHLNQPAAPIRQTLLEMGFLTGDAKNPNVVRLLPPLILTREQIDQFGVALSEVLA
ncbi:MAG: aspartate aminotransferase family protein [Fimbriimonadaceae bacterium]|nr:aspartate aminotransferase family protein [Fimbriimonadaceae bacterium]